MALQYADAATKTLKKAVPTLNADGNVKSWNLTIEYALDGYVSSFPHNISEGFDVKTPESFTKAELFGLVNHAHFDLVYNSQYESVRVITPEVNTVVSDFDVDTLS